VLQKKSQHYLDSLFAAALLCCVCLTSSGAHAQEQLRRASYLASPNIARRIEPHGTGRPFAAAQAAKKGTKSGDAETLHSLGLFAKRQGKREEALKSFEKALSLRMAKLLPNIPAETLQVYSELKPEEQAARLAQLAADYQAAAETAAEYVSLNPEALSFWQEQLANLRYYAAHVNSTSESERLYAPTDVTTRAQFSHKPPPLYTERARQKQRSGKVVLRVTLASDGRVRHILALRHLPDGLTENAIAAARGASFSPAVRDGRPVSTWTTLEYNFNIF
jgi:TonB family protein